jgi:hypothetical protein
MISASPFLSVKDPPASRHTDAWDLAEICLQRTAEALHEVRAATPLEISQAVSTVRDAHAAERPCDLLEVLARIQGHGEEHLSGPILELGNKVVSTLSPYAPLIPFGGKLMAPSAFYDSFDQIHRTARVLRHPSILLRPPSSQMKSAIRYSNESGSGPSSPSPASTTRAGHSSPANTSSYDRVRWHFL